MGRLIQHRPQSSSASRLTASHAAFFILRQSSFEAVGQVVAWTAVELHPRAVLAGDDPEAVLFNLMQPQAAGGRLRRYIGRQGLNRPGGRPRRKALLVLGDRPFDCAIVWPVQK